MAEQVAHDVVKEAQSMGEPLPIDDSAATTIPISAGDGQAPTSNPTSAPEEPKTQETVIAEAVEDAGVQRAATPSIVGEGINGPLQVSADDPASSLAVVDLSGGSDTDSSRPDGLESSKDNHGHVRSNSVKKPPTFKSVSVTKSFLAKAATTSPLPKGTDSRGSSPASGTASTLQSARPRLVAKSGSSGLTPRSGLSTASGTAGGPDASKVWNKNRPIAPPPPKQLTDEELKQQYGIHMATRLQADGDGKEAKWADIDDDEDDWVPETVEWMDGTKSSVVPEEAPIQPPLQAEMKGTVEEQPRPADPMMPPVIAQRPSASSTPKTILKPGTHLNAPAGQQKAANGLILKGAPEKPTLVVKSPSSTPVKSPWATLPPVDKVPLVAPPVQPPTYARFGMQDPHGFESIPPVAAAKEIAADDFNRAWRDEQPTRTLYDSKSGRYEPVNDNRRNSIRDHGYRQPAVLQRPSQYDTRTGPAEPSAAFQTNRAGLDGSWGRRRASSSLSGGSGNLVRRSSIGRSGDFGPPSIDALSQRRESSSFNGSGVSPADQFRAGAPQDARALASPTMSRWTRESPATSNAQPDGEALYHDPSADDAAGSADPSTDPTEDPVAKQQRLMRERLERARQAKQREREREEEEKAARAERLQLKLAGLAPPTPAKEAETEHGLDEQSAVVDQSTQQAHPPAQTHVPGEQQQPSAKHMSPPKPQIPSTGETTQFGLITLHASQPVGKHQVDATFGGRHASGQHPPGLAPHPDSLQPPHVSPPNPGASPADANDRAAGRTAEGNDKFFRKEVNWNHSKNNQGPAGGNIWGVGLGTLGNGTFSNQQAQQMQGLDSTDRSERFAVRPGAPFADSRYNANATGNEATAQTGVDAWARLSKELPERERAEAEQARQKLKQLQQSGYQAEARIQVVHRQTDPNTGRVVGETSNTTRNDSLVYAPQGPVNGMTNGAGPNVSQAGAPRGPGNFITALGPAPAAGQVPLNRAVGAERAHVQVPSGGAVKPSSKFAHLWEHRSGTNSPPPPDALNNELLDGNPKAPGVKLPVPKPQVRLPSTLMNNATAMHQPTQSPSSTPNMASNMTSQPSVPIAQLADWNYRIKNLLSDRQVSNTVPGPARTSPAATAVQPVTSASKATLDVVGAAARAPATVSLPAYGARHVRQSHYRFAIDGSSSVTSKVTAEEDLLEDRQFGSLPAVRVPRSAYSNQAFPDFAKIALARYTGRSHPVETSTRDLLPVTLVEPLGNGKSAATKVKLPSVKVDKTKTTPRKHEGRRQFSGSGRRGGRGTHGHQNSPKSPRGTSHA